MSLLHPTPGEMYDRQTILILKITAYKAQDRDADGLINEKIELENRMGSLEKIPIEAASRLFQINECLWHAEDRVRSLGEDNLRELAATAKLIASLNDQRMKLVRKIDEAFGWKEPVEEKIYTMP